MGGILNNAQILRQLQGGAGGPMPSGPLMGPHQNLGVLDRLPAGHQAAAMAPPPVPGRDFQSLGPYSQQAMGMAGVQPPGPSLMDGSSGGASGGAIPSPVSIQTPPPMTPPPSAPPGKGSPFGGTVQPNGPQPSSMNLGNKMPGGTLGKNSPFGGGTQRDVLGLLSRGLQ